MEKTKAFPEFLVKCLSYFLLPLSMVLWGIKLKNEFIYVLKWWAVFLFIGFLFLPMTFRIFSTFTDKGFMFSKIIGLAISSFIFWLLSYAKLLDITPAHCWSVTVAAGLAVYVVFFGWKKFYRNISGIIDKDTFFWVFTGEGLFLFSLSFWTYLRGFNPKIEGLEKFMDYGFVNSILRSGYVPPKDMWFAGKPINYYYFGQYVTAFLTRLSGLETEISYNVMMATLFAFSMALCFTIVSNMLREHGIEGECPAVAGGLIAAVLVSIGGNLHSFFYGFLAKFTKEGDKYWFPDATRYIGYNPPTDDKTIHEFPVYSFVVSDLHAHVINMIFVLTLIGVLLAVFGKLQRKTLGNQDDKYRLNEIFFPEILLISLFICIFQMSNYWDFPIYLTVTLFVFICAGIRNYGFRKKTTVVTVLRFVAVLLLSLLFALPFNLSFEKIASTVRLARNHSLPHQLLVLWGYQLTFVIVFFIAILYAEQNTAWKRLRGTERLKARNELTFTVRIKNVLEKFSTGDVFAVILCVSAMGLVLIPEIVYVKDIYENGYARANTMFKLTYQAFIMFGLACGYIFIRIRKSIYKEPKLVLAKALTVIMVILPMIYPFYAIPSWYKNLDPQKYEGLDGLAFMKNSNPDDYELVCWLRENVQGQPVVLEANGDSYTYNCRISMATGLPTIQGWYTHEWLWRGDITLIQERISDVKAIYESDDLEMTKELLRKYSVEYIVIGKTEHETFPELNENKLMGLGTVVFERPNAKLIKVEY
ncbi:hypothetical protein CSTERTH_06870 [Thermoclostridium stercorarium subsp. thermolacticum DSM 2910]|uniref:Chlor_Arch_YYY domain-containing protein n=1 Tax=Thermoclostridium stercorarium subsp. thermolacticum DSM 2910 TaxID=1121336 RepID=A0A1B1YDE1_THEST|nr:DUF2298 domain-containing protein [Thermoclostridium stercorarium]ANW98767.1 hypothetical protein CSTERTH_06870 [Thermoclostridium stercorarium subsp. thermolacticum DSM 2910]